MDKYRVETREANGVINKTRFRYHLYQRFGRRATDENMVAVFFDEKLAYRIMEELNKSDPMPDKWLIEKFTD
jgi:hypothetical protein